nr:MetaGeneMark_Unknown Function [uncultured bacterium]
MQTYKQYVISIALGQSHERTALALIEFEPNGDAADLVCDVRHLTRYRLGTGFPEIVADAVKIAADVRKLPDRFGDPSMILEATSAGKPVVDLFQREKRKGKLDARLEAMMISAGDMEADEFADGVRYWRVPKRNLASVVQVLLQTARLRIAPALAESETLVRELQNFKVKINTAATNEMLDFLREGPQDDLVLCVAAGCWKALKWRPPQRSAVGRSIRVHTMET